MRYKKQGKKSRFFRSLSIRVFRSLRNKNYVLFWSSDLIASVGQFVCEMALYWLAYEIADSVWAGILGFRQAALGLPLPSAV